MLTNATSLKGLAIHAKDGEIGTVVQFYFDDKDWAIRYLTVDTGGWLGGREVLVSPVCVLAHDWQGHCLNVSLTKQQVENSPAIDTHRPVSRQEEAAYAGYYGYPFYWASPACSADATAEFNDEIAAARERRISEDSRLRCTDGVNGYAIEAKNGEIGHVEDFILDDEDWAIRYMEVATRNWWPGKKVLVAPSWIKQVSWTESRVRVGLSREVIQAAPEFDSTLPITREYEDRLYSHYGMAPYWQGSAHRQLVLP